jgi:hypothetical protein
MLDAERKERLSKRKSKEPRAFENGEKETLQEFIEALAEEPPELQVHARELVAEDDRYVQPVQWTAILRGRGDSKKKTVRGLTLATTTGPPARGIIPGTFGKARCSGSFPAPPWQPSGF